MKKAITIFALITLYICGKAQEGEIIYREFDPPLEIVQNIYGPSDTLELDFDSDGEADHRYYGKYWDYHEWPIYEESLNGWEIRLVRLDENDTFITFDENDTLIPNATNGWIQGPVFAHYYYPNTATGGIYHETYGMHKVIDGKNYYGWYHCYGMEGRDYPGGPYLFKIYVDKIAFCTIPDYPLCYGETRIIGVEENGSNAFSTIHPNPTNGMVTIMGENLLQAKIINTLGQQVLSVRGKGDELHIDMADLPAGVYFVTVTNEEGHRCVRKVVKK
jgi:hypothetical protein